MNIDNAKALKVINEILSILQDNLLTQEDIKNIKMKKDTADVQFSNEVAPNKPNRDFILLRESVPINNIKRFAHNLYAARKNNRYSRDDLSLVSSVSVSAIRAIETGYRKFITKPILTKLAQGLKVTPYELLNTIITHEGNCYAG